MVLFIRIIKILLIICIFFVIKRAIISDKDGNVLLTDNNTLNVLLIAFCSAYTMLGIVYSPISLIQVPTDTVLEVYESSLEGNEEIVSLKIEDKLYSYVEFAVSEYFGNLDFNKELVPLVYEYISSLDLVLEDDN